MITTEVLQQLAETHGTQLFAIDHDGLRGNYTTFKPYLPRVQAYFGIKANPDPAIIKNHVRCRRQF
jgi:ornithine decarboxylase